MELLESYNHINENLENLIEKKSVFDKASQLFLSENEQSGNKLLNNAINLDIEDGFRSDLNFIAGVIKAEDDIRMKRMVFRISRGRAIPTFFDLVIENKLNVNFFSKNLKFKETKNKQKNFYYFLPRWRRRIPFWEIT